MNLNSTFQALVKAIVAEREATDAAARRKAIARVHAGKDRLTLMLGDMSPEYLKKWEDALLLASAVIKANKQQCQAEAYHEPL